MFLFFIKPLMIFHISWTYSIKSGIKITPPLLAVCQSDGKSALLPFCVEQIISRVAVPYNLISSQGAALRIILLSIQIANSYVAPSQRYQPPAGRTLTLYRGPRYQFTLVLLQPPLSLLSTAKRHGKDQNLDQTPPLTN